MNEELRGTQKMDNHQIPENSEKKPSLGQRLRTAREEQFLSIDEAAKRLNIKTAWVKSLEQDEYNFTAPIYLKGYLRGYSRLLNIHNDIDDWPKFEKHNSNVCGYPPMLYKKQFSTANKSIRWITYAIISLLIVLVIKWWNADVVSPNISMNDQPSIDNHSTKTI